METNSSVNGLKLNKERIGYIDIAKAIAITIVLINHAGLNLGIVTFLGGIIYMPIFFVTAGMTYNNRKDESLTVFAKKKAGRLLVPYAALNALLILIFSLKDIIIAKKDDNIPIYILGALYSRNNLYAVKDTIFMKAPAENIYLMPILNAPLWFLTAMFVTLILYKIIGNMSGQESLTKIMPAFLVFAFLTDKICPILLPFSIDTAFLFIIFVWLGSYIRNNKLVEVLYDDFFKIILLLTAFLCLSWINGSVNLSVRDYGRLVFIYTIAAGAGCIITLIISRFIEEKLGILAAIMKFVGRHTLSILCFHLIIFAVVEKIGSLFYITGNILKIAEILIALFGLSAFEYFIRRKKTQTSF